MVPPASLTFAEKLHKLAHNSLFAQHLHNLLPSKIHVRVRVRVRVRFKVRVRVRN